MKRTLIVAAVVAGLAAACSSSNANDTTSTSSATSAGSGSSSGSETSSGSSSTGTSSGAGGGGAGGSASSFVSGLLTAHNAARASVMPAASPAIPPLVWSDTVAAAAQTWANNCMFAHNSSGYGQNIFAGTGDYAPSDVVTSWTSEASSYDYATNTCSATCGHYTQVVWRGSTSLGCGMATCTANSPFGGSGSWQLWVCDYDPAGNIEGESPY